MGRVIEQKAAICERIPMNGQLYRGLQSLEELAALSGYQDSQESEK